MTKNQLLEMLKTGDMRSIGKSNEVVKEVLNNNKLMEGLISGLTSKNEGLRMRVADACEKIGNKKPELLQPHVEKLLNIAKESKQQEVQWHMAQMLSYVKMDTKQMETAAKILNDYFETSRSNIVKVMSMQTLTNFAKRNHRVFKSAKRKVNTALTSGIPSLVSRGRRLLLLLSDN